MVTGRCEFRRRYAWLLRSASTYISEINIPDGKLLNALPVGVVGIRRPSRFSDFTADLERAWSATASMEIIKVPLIGAVQPLFHCRRVEHRASGRYMGQQNRAGIPPKTPLPPPNVLSVGLFGVGCPKRPASSVAAPVAVKQESGHENRKSSYESCEK